VTNGPTGTLVGSLKLEPGLGEVGSGASSRVVKPNKTTTYTLTATGCGGTVTQQITVTVGSSVKLDLALINVYRNTHVPGDELRMTVKNTGNIDLTNAGGNYTCLVDYTAVGGSKQTQPPIAMPFSVTLKVGAQTSIGTNYSMYKTGTYDVKCTISPGSAFDTDSSNNTFSKQILKGP